MRRMIFAVAMAAALAACSGGDKSGSSGSGGTTSTSSGNTTGTSSGNTTGTSSGNTTGTSSGTTGSTDAQAFCNQAYPLLCQYFITCGVIDPALSCTTLLGELGAQCGSAGQSYDASAGQSCLTTLQAAATGTCDSAALDTSSCKDVFTPSVTEGGSCQAHDDCIQRPDGGYVDCQRSPGTCTGVCSAGATLGQACSGFPSCVEGYCDYAGSNTCVAYVSEGGSCASGGQCDPRVDRCNSYDDGGTCTPLAGSGQSCAYAGDCAQGYYCQSADGGFSGGTCQPRGQVGDPCTESQFQTNCASGLTCFQGTCHADTAALGQTCAQGIYCDQGYCSGPDGGAGTCTAYSELGQSCSSSRCDSDFNLYCDGGVCTGRNTQGQPCTQNHDCRGGDYCDNGTCHLVGSPGDGCPPGNSSACANGFCNASGICSAFLSAGSACDPSQTQCSNSIACSSLPDGGGGCQDAQCQPTDAGAWACAASCGN